jgi:DNA replication protein DnaC
MEIEMDNVVPMKRRELTKDDLLRMKIPDRYWYVRFNNISDEKIYDKKNDEYLPSPHKVVGRYIEKLTEMRARGMGLILWGANGCGKTSMAVVIAKEFRRQFHPVLYLSAADLKRLVTEKESFDDEETYWQRAMTVDVLILDDLGKGTQDSVGFGERLIDELIRERNAKGLVTIITTNMQVGGAGENQLKDALKEATMHTLKEHVVPVEVRGEDKREGATDWAASQILQT